MIRHDTIEKVHQEIARYLNAESRLKNKFILSPDTYSTLEVGVGCKESAALKRASLDLSRALTELRHVPRR